MKDVDPDVQAELEAESSRVRYGLTIELLGGETIRIGQREETIDGDTYLDALDDAAQLASSAKPEDRQLDVQTVALSIDNTVGAAIAGGGRFSDAIPDDLEGGSALLEMIVDTSSGTKREPVFLGVPRFPVTYTTLDANVTLGPLIDRALKRPLLDLITAAGYPFSRVGDRGKTVPIAVGSAKDGIGRVTKAGAVTEGVPGSNVGTGTLDRPRRGNAVISTARTWTVTVLAAETVEFAGPGDTDSTATSIKGSSGVATLFLEAQSFQTVATRPVAAVVLPLALPAAGPSATVELMLCTDNANTPSLTVLGRATAVVNSAVSSEKTFAFASPVTLTGGVRYWIVIRVYPIAGATRSVKWRAKAAGGYASQKPMEANNEPDDGGPYAWTNHSDGRDNLFRLVLGASGSPQFDVVASPGGSQGSGDTGTDFTASNGEVVIPSSSWAGSPAGGDTFVFLTDAGDAEVIFAESPTATPCAALSDLRINGIAIGSGGSTISQTADGGTAINFGPSAERAIGQSFTLAAPMLVRAVTVKMNRNATMPNAPVILSLRRASAGENGPPEGDALGSATIPAAQFATTGTALSWPLDAPAVLEAGTYWLVAETAATNTGFGWYWSSTSGFAGRAARLDATTGVWTLYVSTTDIHFEIIAAAVSISASAADVSGRMVARARIPSLDIPDAWQFVADASGVVDTSAGLYSGSPNASLSIPADFAHYIAARGLDEANIDAAGTFLTARGAAGSLYRFNGYLETPGLDLKAALLDLAAQANCELDWSVNVLQFRWLEASPEAVETIEWAMIEPDSDAEGAIPDIRAVRGDFADVVNVVRARFDRDPTRGDGADAYRRLYVADDAASVAAFGEIAKDDQFFLSLVTSEAMVADLASRTLVRRSFPPLDVEWTSPLDLWRLEKGDPVNFNLPEET